MGKSTVNKYCHESIEKALKDFGEGEGLKDIERMAMPDAVFDLKIEINECIWLTLRKFFNSHKDEFSKIDVYNDAVRGYNSGYDETYVNHRLNELVALGLLSRKKHKGKCTFEFPRMIRKMGMDWFLNGNERISRIRKNLIQERIEAMKERNDGLLATT